MHNKARKPLIKKGFTMIEVLFFLAISGLILAYVISDTAGRTARYRYNDTVTDVVEEIRNAYSATINVENDHTPEDTSVFCSITTAFDSGGGLTVNSPIVTTSGTSAKKTDNHPGRTRCAIYGQLLTFGEPTDVQTDKKAISVLRRYTLVGLAVDGNLDDLKNAVASGGDDVLKGLELVGANIVTLKQKDNSVSSNTECSVATIGNTATHQLQWTGRVENREDRNSYRGAILIARSPISGTVHTYFYSNYGNKSENSDGEILKDNPDDDQTFFINEWLKDITNSNRTCGSFSPSGSNTNGYFVNKAIRENKFIKNKKLDLCIGSDDLIATNNKRRAIRIHGGGSTESSVELLTENDSTSTCKVVE